MNVKLDPTVSTLNLNLGDRSLGGILEMEVKGSDLSTTETDLAGDIFHSLFTNHARKDPLPTERTINGHLLDWMSQSTHWPELAGEGRNNIAASLLGGELLHGLLMQDGPMREALKKQEEAAQQKEAAQEAQDTADAQAQANFPADQVANAQQRAAQLAAQAGQAQDAANSYFSRLAQNNLSRAVAANMVGKAADKASEVAACFSGWGHGPGSQIALDPTASLEFMKAHNHKITQIAMLAGRWRGIGFDARRQQVVRGELPDGVELTKDPNRILPSELVRLSPNYNPLLRKLALAQYGQYGLLGRRTSAVKNEQGPFVFGADVSGSMHGEREIAAKAVGLGMAQIAAADQRLYSLFSFSSSQDNLIICNSGESWQKHVEWAAKTIHGGTDFDIAIRKIIATLRAMGEAGHNADGVIASDGEAIVSPEVVLEWTTFKAETGARLLYIEVAEGYGSLELIADKVLNVPDLFLGADDLMRDAATWMN